MATSRGFSLLLVSIATGAAALNNGRLNRCSNETNASLTPDEDSSYLGQWRATILAGEPRPIKEEPKWGRPSPANMSRGGRPLPRRKYGYMDEESFRSRTDRGGETDDRTSQAVVFLLGMGITLTAYIFAMTQTAIAGVSLNTIQVVDNITSIFLAVLWFQGVDDLTNTLPEGHHQVMAAVIHAVILLSVAFMLAWALKSNAFALAWFCGCAAHYCAFASVHAGSTAQEHHFSWSLYACVGGLVAIFTVLLVCGFLLYMVKKAFGVKPGEESDDEGQNRFVDRFDDVETDFGGVCMAAYWTVVVRYAIVGRYPESEEIEPGEEVDHTAQDRNGMLLYVFAMAVIGIGFVWFKSQLATPNYPSGRILGLLQSFCCVSIAFGFLFWGKMHFYEQPTFSVVPIMARLYFAGLCSLIAMIGIFALSGLKLPLGSSALAVGLATLGLVAGVAWEEVFDACVEVEVEGSAHEDTAKLFIAILASAIILPVHGMYLKPLALKAEEEEEEEEEADQA